MVIILYKKAFKYCVGQRGVFEKKKVMNYCLNVAFTIWKSLYSMSGLHL